MWDFRIGYTFGLMARTFPFILLRIGIYVGIALAFILLTAAGAGIGWLIADGGGAFWGGLIFFAIVAGVLFFFRDWLLYMVKAAHVAVLVELLDGKDIPQGKNQVAYGRAVVKERFAQANVLFGLDLLIKGVLRAVVRFAEGILSVLPFNASGNVASLLKAFLNVAVGFIDEVILAHAIRTRSTNAWASAKDALILYGQNYKVMLKNAAWLTVIVYVIAFILFLIFLAPGALIALMFPDGWGWITVVIALLLAWSVKAALLEPFAITCLMQVYFTEITGQVPDPVWDERLSSWSAKFRQIKEKAMGWASGAATPPPPPPAAPAPGSIPPV